MNDKITEKEAYEAYVKACHSKLAEWVSEFNFNECELWEDQKLNILEMGIGLHLGKKLKCHS